MQQGLASSQAALQHRIHSLLTGVMQAMEGAGRTVCDCTAGVPWECTMDMARQVWDRARHVEIYLQLLVHVEDDASLARALDFVVADEMTHERLRSTWLRELPADAPERLRKALESQQHLAE